LHIASSFAVSVGSKEMREALENRFGKPRALENLSGGRQRCRYEKASFWTRQEQAAMDDAGKPLGFMTPNRQLRTIEITYDAQGTILQMDVK